MKKKLAWIIFIFWLLPGLACSLVSTSEAPPFLGGPSNAAEFATAIAATQQHLALLTQTAVPGQTFYSIPEPTIIYPYIAEPTVVFPSFPEPTPIPESPEISFRPAPMITGQGSFIYISQPGDTLPAVAGRFSVEPGQIGAAEDIPGLALINPGLQLNIPNTLGEVYFLPHLMPDGAIIYSPAAARFDTYTYVQQAGGYLNTYREDVKGENLSGAAIVQRLAEETSIDPRLLLAVLEHRARWVYGQPPTYSQVRNPIGFNVPQYTGLYKELSLTAKQLSLGYYGWRAGAFTSLQLYDRTTFRLNPDQNAGTVALQYLFAVFSRKEEWGRDLYEPAIFMQRYIEMFGDPWEHSAQPLYPAGLFQPTLELPFAAGERWAYTGGPHITWITGTPPGALDFAPTTAEGGCNISRGWVTASAAGLVVRSGNGVVAIDLDGDGLEQTGWVLVYLHIASRDRIPLGAYVNLDDRLGHPSCEGGVATGTHVHIARKYNGEWISAEGPLPFVLSGWLAQPGSRQYKGYLVRGEQFAIANPDGPATSIVTR